MNRRAATPEASPPGEIRRLSAIARVAAVGGWRHYTDVRHQSSGSLERHLLHASNRLAFALIVASIVVGSSLLLSAQAGPFWQELPLLGIAGFAVAGVLGIAWAILALRSGKL